MAIASPQCLKAIGLGDSDDDGGAVDMPNATGNVVKSEAVPDVGRPMELGVSRRAMKRSVAMIWGPKIGQHMGLARFRPLRSEDTAPARTQKRRPTHIKPLDLSQKVAFIKACKLRCSDLESWVNIDWAYADASKRMEDASYVADIAGNFMGRGFDVKVGITTCARWRMLDCEDHNKDFYAYAYHGFKAMFITIVEVGARAGQLEMDAIEKMRALEPRPGRVLNRSDGGDGAIRNSSAYLCYVVVKPRH